MDFIETFEEWIENKPNTPQTDAPSCYMKAMALMILSCVIKKNYTMKYGSKILTPNLWCLILGKSSFFRKSTSLEIGQKMISKVDPKCVLPNDFSMEKLVGILDDSPQGAFVIDEFEAFYKQFGRSYMSVVGETKILTKNGLREISEVIDNLKPNEEVLSLDENYKTSWNKITGYHKDYRSTVKLFYQGCPEPIECSEDHSVFVLRKDYSIKEKEASEIVAGDYLVSYNEYPSGEEADTEQAWLYGAFVAEGSFRKTQYPITFTINSNEIEFKNEIIRIASKWEWGKKPCIIKLKNQNCIQIVFCTKDANEFFACCRKSETTKRVPVYIWTSGYKTRLAFWKGWYEGDGNRKRGDERLTTASASLSSELSWLEKSLGASLYIGQDKGSAFHQYRHYTDLLQKEDNLPFKERKDKTIPTKFLWEWRNELKKEYQALSEKNRQMINLTRERNTYKYKDKMRSDFIKDAVDYLVLERESSIPKNLKKILDNNISFRKVERIEKSNILKPVYDVSVEKTERFFGGHIPILLHNTGGLSLITSLYDRNMPYVRKLQEIEYNIVDPFLNMISATTINSFENTIKVEDIHSGFLPRWFFVVATKKERNIELPGVPDVGKELDLINHLSEARKHKAELVLSPEAEKIYKHFYNTILSRYNKEMGNGLSPFITRLLTTGLKFAILFHVSHSFDGTITEEDMRKACAYTDESIQNARRLLRAISIDQFQQLRRQVLYCIWNIQKTNSSHWVSKTDLLRELRIPTTKLNTVLETLIEEETIICDTDKPTGGGRTKTIYQVTSEAIEWEGLDG